jgi:hypothetical protein
MFVIGDSRRTGSDKVSLEGLVVHNGVHAGIK